MKTPRIVGARAFQWFLILVALVLLMLLIRSRRNSREAEPVVSPPLPKGASARVVAIDRESGAGQFSLEREEGTWYLRAPIEDLASKRLVRELLRALEELPVRRVLVTDEVADYGLDPPRSTMVLRMLGGVELEVQMGAEAPASGEIYARWSGLRGVALVPPHVPERFFNSELHVWREREILPPARSAIDSVHVLCRGESARLKRIGREKWEFLDPADREADGLSVERTLAAFWRFTFLKFYDRPGDQPDQGTGSLDQGAGRRDLGRDPSDLVRDPSDLGLAPPAAVWTVFRGDRVDTLRMGARLDQATMVMQLAGRVPGRVRDDLYDYLTGGIRVLEVRRFVRGRSRDQQVAALSSPLGSCGFLRRGSGWWVRRLGASEARDLRSGLQPDTTGAEWTPAGDPAVSGDLANLFDLEGERWMHPHETAPVADEYALRVHLWDVDGSYQWVFFQPDGGGPASEGSTGRGSGSAESFTGTGIGSRFPQRPLRVDSPIVRQWQARLAGVLERH